MSSAPVPGMPLHIQHGTALVLLALVLSMNLVANHHPELLSVGEDSGKAEDTDREGEYAYGDSRHCVR